MFTTGSKFLIGAATLATISAIARDAGFTKPGVEQFVDAEGFHRLLCFAT